MEQIRTTSGIAAAVPPVVTPPIRGGIVAYEWAGEKMWENLGGYTRVNDSMTLDLGTPDSTLFVVASLVIHQAPPTTGIDYMWFNAGHPGLLVSYTDDHGTVDKEIDRVPTTTRWLAGNAWGPDSGQVGFAGCFAFAATGPTTLTTEFVVEYDSVSLHDPLTEPATYSGTILIFLNFSGSSS